MKLALVSGSTTSTFTVDSSCTVNDDLATSIYNALDAYVTPSLSALDIIVTLINNDISGTLFTIPDFTHSGVPTDADIAQINNATDRQILWSLLGQVPGILTSGLAPNVQYSDVTGYTLDYAFSSTRYASNKASGSALAIIPESPSLTAYGTSGIYKSCSSTQYLYYIDATTGEITNTTSFSYGSSNICTKNWYYPAFQTTSTIWSYPYFGSTSNSLIYGLAKQFTHQTSSGARKGVAEVSFIFNNLGTFISDIPSTGTQYAYIMTQLNPQYLLVATNVGLTLSTTTYATSSTNKYINGTANYIVNNGILSDTQVYIDSLGCMMTVKFWTSPNGEAGTITIPTDFSTTVMPATLQANWIVVSCSVEPNPSTTYTTTSTSNGADDDSVSYSDVQAVTGLAATVFVLLVLVILFMGAYALGLFTRKPPMSGQENNSSAGVEVANKA